MHPVIRIVCLIVLTVFLSRAELAGLAATAILLILLYAITSLRYLVPAVHMLRQLRWLLASIFILYLWFTPGEPVATGITNLSGLLPSGEGIAQGAQRLAALVLVVLAVNLLLQSTSRNHLLTGICWLSRPLGWFGVERERLALRLILTLETVPAVRMVLGRHLGQSHENAGRIAALAGSVASLFQDIIHQAETAPLHEITLDQESGPAPVEWLYPLALAGMYSLLFPLQT